MQIDFKIEVVSNQFGEIGQKTETLLDQVVRKTAFDLEKRAKGIAAVDTGAMRASIYVSTGKQSTFGQARAEAMSRNPNARFAAEVKPEGPLEAIVAVGVLYAVYIEFGTIRMPAQPFFGPAVEAVRVEFERAVAAALAGNTV